MNYLTLVQKAMDRAGVRTSSPTTLVDVVDVTADFKRYVADSWRELQNESVNWWFRQKYDQTLAVSDGVDQYAMPSDLETLNYRTATLYTTPKEDEGGLGYMTYEEWRTTKDTVATYEQRPTYIVERPDGILHLWPVPDQAYTLRYDGVWDVDDMLIDTDTPGSNITGGSMLLPEKYQWLIIYDAVIRHHAHHENEEGVREVQPRYKAMRARLSEKQTPPIYVKPGILTGLSGTYRRLGQWL